MKVYELTFADPEFGLMRQWKRNKREIKTFVNSWKREFPLRQLLLTQRIAIPEDKQGIVDWLNENAKRVSK